VITRALLASVVLALAAPSLVRADECAASTVDVADWPIVRSPRVPGFTLRLPRSFTRDSAGPRDGGVTARWSDAARGRFTMSHVTVNATPASFATTDPATVSTRCETRVGSATATIIAWADGPSAHVVHAQIQWPDGEAVEVRADALDRTQLALLIAAVRTIRRAGA